MAIGLTDADEGKRVIDANGNEVGIVSTVEGETALVDPDPSLTDDEIRLDTTY